MLSNYEKLQNNKKQALDFANKVIESKSEVSRSYIELRQELMKKQDLTSAIEILAEMKDKQNNIHWYKDGDNLVRDGREAKNPPSFPAESYAIQYLNHVRTAITLTSDEELKKSLQEKAIANIDSFLDIADIKLLEQKVTKENSKLAITLMKKGIINAVQKIKLAKDFANFQDKHYHITTLSRIKDADVIESEIMHLGLTQAQEKMFQAINSYTSTDPDKSMVIKLDGEDMSWFNKCKRWQQDQIKRYAPIILAENHVIPTQLRSFIPLLRNSYTKVNAIKRNGQPIQEILETMHSGSIILCN